MSTAQATGGAGGSESSNEELEMASLRWEFDGLISLADPPREDTRETIARAYEHGVEVKMITGDQTAIARETCRQLAMGSRILPGSELTAAERAHTAGALVRDADGFAEVFPETKFRIVELLQLQGFTVGMTGDGVNDAPALKKAQIGIAVSGATDAARAAADIVLVEDGLSVIIDAILRARKIFQRVRNYGIYRVACTIQLVFFFFFAVVFVRPADYFCASNARDLVNPNGYTVRCTASPPLSTHDRHAETMGYASIPPTVPAGSHRCWQQSDPVHPRLWFYHTDHDLTCPTVYPAAQYRFTLPVLAIVIITILNDVCIITIARDNVVANKEPQQWRLPELYTIAAVCGLVPLLSSLLLLMAGLRSADGYNAWFSHLLGAPASGAAFPVDPYERRVEGAAHSYLEYDQLLMVMYLKVSISDFLTVFSARTRSFFFTRRPGFALLGAAALATSVSTLIATRATIPDDTYMMKPITAKAALFVWLYNLVWFLAQDCLKIFAYWCFGRLKNPAAERERERLRNMRSRRELVMREQQAAAGEGTPLQHGGSRRKSALLRSYGSYETFEMYNSSASSTHATI
jgi:H+-transporting ATPase